MNITKLAVKNNRVIMGLIILTVIAGLITFNDMPRSDLPSHKVRYAKIVTHFPGASPERVEVLVSDPLEKALQQITEIKDIISENRQGISVITLVVKDEIKEIGEVWTDVRHRVENTRSELPEGVTDVVVRDEYDDVYGIIIGLEASTGYSYKELRKIALSVKERIFKIPETAKVEIVGEQQERIFIDYDNASLAAVGLTKTRLQQIISTSNIVTSSGSVVIGHERVVLEPTGSFQTLDDLKRLVIPSGENDVIYLGDVTRIYKGYEDPQRFIVRVNGKSGLAIAIAMKKGHNIVSFGEKVDDEMLRFNKSFPVGLELTRLVSYDKVIEENIQSFTRRLLIGILLVLLFMISFLGFQMAMVISSLVPMSLFMSLVIMDLTGIGLNQVSIVALMLSLPMLVYHAISMAEAIQSRMQLGIPPLEACYRSTRELALPLFIASLTVSAAFLCFMLAESILGELFSNLFKVISIVLICSWLLSQTVIPVIVSKFVHVNVGPPVKKKIIERLRIRYRWSLGRVMQRRRLIGFVILLFVILSAWFIYQLPFRYFPPPERNLIYAQFHLPAGTNIEYTQELTGRVEQFITDSLLVGKKNEKGVRRFSTFIGKGAPNFDIGYIQEEENPAFANMLIITTGADDNQWVINRLDRFCFERLPRLNAFFSRLYIDGRLYPVEVQVSGEDVSELLSIVKEIKIKLDSIDGTKKVIDNWGLKTKKFVVDIDQAKAQLADLTNEDIALSLQTVLTGAKTGEFMEEYTTLPIILRSPQVEKNDFRSLESVNIYSPASGQKVPLKAVADIRSEWQYGTIHRKNLYPTATVSADLFEGYTASKVNKFLYPWLVEQSSYWPDGYTFEMGGEAEEGLEALWPVLNKVGYSFAAIGVLLLLAFHSFRKALLILLSIPAGMIGVLTGLFITQSYIGLFAFVGSIAMGGIAINISILLMERIEEEVSVKGQELSHALLKAARQRMRPVLLTLITTVLAMLPLWVPADYWKPMAVSVIFGVCFASIYVLYVLPAVYLNWFRTSHGLKNPSL